MTIDEETALEAVVSGAQGAKKFGKLRVRVPVPRQVWPTPLVG